MATSAPVSRESLLVNELGEINNYVRSSAAVYVSWYTMTFTVNILLIGYLIANESNVSKALYLARCVFGMAALADVLSVITTLSIRSYMISSNARITAILDLLWSGQGNTSIEVHSPVPLQSTSLIYGLAVLALSALVLLWTVLAIIPGVFFH